MMMKFHILDGLSSILGLFTNHLATVGPVLAGLAVRLGIFAVATKLATINVRALIASFEISPIGMVAIALGAVTFAAIWVANHFQTTKLVLMEAWNTIVKATQWAVNTSIALINDYLRVCKFAFDAIKWAGISIWDGIVKAAQDGVNRLLKFVSPFSGIMKHVGINIPA